MARVVHFGITNDAQHMTPADVILVTHVIKAVGDNEGGLARGFVSNKDSFTAWGESLMSPEEPDALHILHVTDCEMYDEDDERIRLSNDEVSEVAECLKEIVSRLQGYRVVDHWVEGDYDDWSQDNYVHGPFALVSGSGKTI